MSRIFSRAGGDWGSALIGTGRGLMDLWAERQAEKQRAADAERARAFQIQLRNAAWNREDTQNKESAARINDALAGIFDEQPAGEGTPGAGVTAAPASPSPTPASLELGPPSAPVAAGAAQDAAAIENPLPPPMPRLRGLQSAGEIASVLNAYHGSPRYKLFQTRSNYASDALVEALRAQRKAKEEADAAARERQNAMDEQAYLESQGLLPDAGGLDGRSPPTPRIGTMSGVRAAASAYGQRQGRDATAAERATDNARADQALELNRQRVEAYIKGVQSKGAAPTEDDIMGLADAIQQANPGIPASQAMGMARGRLQYKAPMQIPTETLAQKGEAKVLDGQIESLRTMRQNVLKPNGVVLARKLGAEMKIPEIPDKKDARATAPDLPKIIDALDQQIKGLESKRKAIGTPVNRATSAPESPAYQPKLDELLGP